MSDKPVVRDFDHQVAPGVDAHTHEETKTGKNTYEHKSETGFEGPNVTGSAYEKTKVTMAEDKSKHASTHGSTHGTSAATSGSHTSSHSSSQHAASHTTSSSSSQHQQSSALDTRHHDSSSVTGADGKPIVRDYDYQVAPGVAAHTHEELKTGKNTYEHKAETGFEGPNVVGSAYEKTTVKMSGGDKSAASGSHHHSSEHGHHAHFAEGQQQHASSGGSHATSGSSSTHTEVDSRHTTTGASHGSATTASSAGTVSTKPIERDYDYQPAPGVQAHTHEVIKQGTNTYEHKAETTFEGPNTTGSAYEKTTVKMSGPKHT